MPLRVLVSCLIVLFTATIGLAQPSQIGPPGALQLPNTTFVGSGGTLTINAGATFTVNGSYAGTNPPPATSGNNTWTGTNTFNNTVSGSGPFNLTLGTLSGTAAGTYTLGGSGTFTGSGGINTAGNATLNNLTITGTCTGCSTSTPTFTLKKGTGAGNYTTTSTTYVDVDATNLAYSVTVPVGQKVLINAAASTIVNGTAGNTQLALADGTTTLAEGVVTGLTGAPDEMMSLVYVFVGDGAAHTFKLRWLQVSGNTATLLNTSGTLTPMMTFYLGPAN